VCALCGAPRTGLRGDANAGEPTEAEREALRRSAEHMKAARQATSRRWVTWAFAVMFAFAALIAALLGATWTFSKAPLVLALLSFALGLWARLYAAKGHEARRKAAQQVHTARIEAAARFVETRAGHTTPADLAEALGTREAEAEAMLTELSVGPRVRIAKTEEVLAFEPAARPFEAIRVASEVEGEAPLAQGVHELDPGEHADAMQPGLGKRSGAT
jgi:hypothetical protein